MGKFDKEKNYMFVVYRKNTTEFDNPDAINKKFRTAQVKGSSLIQDYNIETTDQYFRVNPHKYPINEVVGIFQVQPDGNILYLDSSNPSPHRENGIQPYNSNTGVGMLADNVKGDPSRMFDKLYAMNKDVADEYKEEMKGYKEEIKRLTDENVKLKGEIEFINIIGGKEIVIKAVEFFRKFNEGNEESLRDSFLSQSNQGRSDEFKKIALNRTFDLADRVLGNLTNNPALQERMVGNIEKVTDYFTGAKNTPENSNVNSVLNNGDANEPTE